MATPNLLKLTMQQRKSLYKWWWKHYTNTFEAYDTSDNPNKLTLERITYEWFEPNLKTHSYFGYTVQELIEKYRPKFVLWAQKRVKARGGWPKIESRTKVIEMFLRRGFLHTSDVDYVKDKYPVVTLIGELQWPKYFDLHQEALEFSKTHGVPGYTKCPIPK